MNLLNWAAELWFDWILAASWQLALLICIVAVISRLAKAASPRLRHAFWLLVLVKVFLPPGLTAPWSVGRWTAPLLTTAGWSSPLYRRTDRDAFATTRAALGGADGQTRNAGLSPAAMLMIGWTAGGLLFFSIVGGRYTRLVRAIRSVPAIDEGPLRVALEQLAIELQLSDVPDLRSTPLVTSPFLFGVRRPCIVLPEKALAELSEGELQAVLTHELVHFQRRDTWVGWLQVLAQGLFWFHPLVWWANSQLRHERESACDDTVLRSEQIEPQHYGESMVRVLTASRGRSLVAGSLVGVFERGVRFQERLEDIMNFEPRKREFGFGGRLLLAALAIGLLPMAPGAVQSAPGDTPYPQIVKTKPQGGATGVDPDLKEITVTFDRDMSSGMSWTGVPPEFPPLDESRKAKWSDARTCVLPVKLEKGKFYRVGINDTRHVNFKSSTGAAAPPVVICFVTKGATAEVEKQLQTPQIVSLDPKNGAADVDPATQSLRVTFSIPMNAGMSWTGGGDGFPRRREGQEPAWSGDGLTCTLPVALEPGHEYQLGLNSLSHNNFQSRWGVPLAPTTYKFRTQNAK